VLLAFAVVGFDWLDGLAATRSRYWAGVAHVRPFRYFAIANLAALGLCVGPAVASALSQVRRAPTLPLVGATLAALAIADASAMSKGEVERIWLPYAIWLLPAAATFATRPRWMYAMLALQAATAIALQTFIHSS
jgi:hypothetical protein